MLTYADLSSLFDDPDGREPERTVGLHLTGHMQRFMWWFDGVPFSAAPSRASSATASACAFKVVNDTMMEHAVALARNVE